MGGPFAEVQMAATLAVMLYYAEFDRAPSNERASASRRTWRPHGTISSAQFLPTTSWSLE